MIIIMTIICRCCSKTSRAWSQTNFANIIILEFIAVCVIALHVFHLSTDVRYIVVVAQQLPKHASELSAATCASCSGVCSEDDT